MSCIERPSEPCQQPVGPAPSISPPGTPPAVAIGPAVASSVTMASTAHLLMSGLGDLATGTANPYKAPRTSFDGSLGRFR